MDDQVKSVKCLKKSFFLARRRLEQLFEIQAVV
jgi:hypothetical protein